MGLTDEDVPWAMQLVARVEKADPPGHRAVCAAAATAVVALLTDPRAAGGEWAEAVGSWEDRRIRKVARRARGVRWPEVERLPGVTAEVAGAQVRAFVPAPVAEVPFELSRLQVAGLDLPDEGELPAPDRPYAAIALNPQVAMTTGKAAAQAGHAAHLLLRNGAPADVVAWLGAGGAVTVVDAPWRDCVTRAAVSVRDAGFTEVAPGTMTALGWFVPPL